jgi:hypothetical protein
VRVRRRPLGGLSSGHGNGMACKADAGMPGKPGIMQSVKAGVGL